MSKTETSNKLLIVVLILLGIILLAAISFGIYYYLNTAQEQTTLSEKKLEKQKNREFKEKDALLEKKLGTEELLEQIGPLYKLDTFTTNLLSHSQGERYLRATITLELSNKDLANELDAKKAVLRNDIIEILSNQFLETISSDMGKEQVCTKIKNVINAQLTDGKIKHVYFSDFIIQ